MLGIILPAVVDVEIIKFITSYFEFLNIKAGNYLYEVLPENASQDLKMRNFLEIKLYQSLGYLSPSCGFFRTRVNKD